jgi:glycosyltransferase involved in cell wall biosynthesis
MIADGVTGILVPPSDAATMGAALRRVLAADDSGAGMGAAARQRVETEFTLTGMMQRYERMYTEVARSKGVVSDTSPVQPLPRSGVA